MALYYPSGHCTDSTFFVTDAARPAVDKLLASAANAARAGVSAYADTGFAIGQFLGTRSLAFAS
ncbi:MAG: hypothetical protein B7X36_00210 [Thiomonas sp. 14-64-326]|jgi:hypothetical protein|nr:MAG: hypothetical protein B7X36_00210 [Thiomonas sp. 14-64-326]